MDYISVTRVNDLKTITVALDSIVSFYDDTDCTTRISLINQEYIITNEAISSKLRKQLTLMTHRIIKVGD